MCAEQQYYDEPSHTSVTLVEAVVPAIFVAVYSLGMADPLLPDAEIQRLLNVLGYTATPAGGTLREETWRAILKKFQTDQGLSSDGWYGVKSDTALRALATQLGSAPKEMKQCRRWRITQYYVAGEGEHAGTATTPILTPSGFPLAYVTAGDFASAALEGTIKLKDGRLLNVAGQNVKAPQGAYDGVLAIAQKNGWVPSKPGYAGLVLDSANQVKAVSAFSLVAADKIGDGYGTVRGIPMSPYRTLAADIGAYKTSEPQFYGKGGVLPPGTEFFIAEFVGKTCPNGKGGTFVHDGWFVVNDTGGGIFGAHVDVFSGSRAMALQISHPNICHVWFRGMAGGRSYTAETRLPYTYSYGL